MGVSGQAGEEYKLYSLPASHSLKRGDRSVLTIVSRLIGGFKLILTRDFEKENIWINGSILIINCRLILKKRVGSISLQVCPDCNQRDMYDYPMSWENWSFFCIKIRDIFSIHSFDVFTKSNKESLLYSAWGWRRVSVIFFKIRRCRLLTPTVYAFEFLQCFIQLLFF